MTRPMSTTSTTGAFWPTNAPGSTARRATKPLTGETMTVLARLMRSSSSRAVDCVFCARARSSWATADWYRASVSSSVCFGRSCRAKRLRERSALVSASWRSASRCLIVALRDFESRLLLFDLLLQLEVFDLGDALSARHAIAELDRDSWSRPAARGTTATVASPIRLPTTTSCCMTDPRGPSRPQRSSGPAGPARGRPAESSATAGARRLDRRRAPAACAGPRLD